MRLSELLTGEKAVIVKVLGHGGFRKRILEMGFVRGKVVESLQDAPLLDPVKYRIMSYEVSLRRTEAENIEVISTQEVLETSETDAFKGTIEEDELRRIALTKRKHINIALVGNPNCGKTSLFNMASGSHEHVGNYGGVTVDAKEVFFNYMGYSFKMVDLPGTYSLSAYSPEEIYVRRHLVEDSPDVVVNVVDGSNIERNLFLTAQLIDMNVPMVIALNMYDDLQKSGNKLDHFQLGKLLGAPIVPTIGPKGWGLDTLFQVVIKVYEGTDEITRHIHVNHGPILEKSIDKIRAEIIVNQYIRDKYSTRFLAIKLLEKDKEVETLIQQLPNAPAIFTIRDKSVAIISQKLKEDPESALTNAKYGFISGALAETFKQGKVDVQTKTRFIDSIVINKYLGYPIFLLFLFIMFECTFILGQYPMDWIKSAVGLLAGLVDSALNPGPLKDLLVDGIIGGVGGVIVYLPNILILYFFISFMEDSGYMSRAAFIMDKIMHKMGLHGKSFIPLIMGFGCSVPAVLSTRTIENRNNRMVTMLITPLMSCSARLPVYLLLAGVFFPNHAGMVLFCIYLLGILLAVLMARLFKRFFFHREEIPFVMELPPFRMPTLKSIFRHMWEKASQYLRKMGTVILVGSIIVWFLGYFPLSKAYENLPTEKNRIAQQENSYIGQIGKFIEPVLSPLGFDWKMGVSIVSGVAAKEIVVSTLSVLYLGDHRSDVALSSRLKADTYRDGTPVFNGAVALSLMVFVLLYFPCIATITAIKTESGSWKWGLFVVVYTLVLAWVAAFVVYRIALLFIG